MPTRIRIDLAGYHHIINRGVDRMNVFRHDKDKEMFLQILNKASILHKVVLHDYCLMDNHYHLLIETEKDNLSDLMRVVNANYALYFNKKTKRIGHLWQGRYTSRYISSEQYLYTLIRYIEFNPLEAEMAKKVGEYPYTLASLIFNNQEHKECCQESLLLKQYDIETLSEFLNVEFTEEEQKYLQEQQKRKIKKGSNGILLSKIKTLDEHFVEVKNKIERNKATMRAYKDGYKQVEIAQYLGLSKSHVSKVLKKVEI